MRYVHVKSIKIGSLDFSSMEQCFYSCYLAQHHFFEDALRLIASPEARKPTYPEQIARTIMARRQVPVKASWIMNRDHILRAIFWEFYYSQSTHNDFRGFIDFIISQYDVTHGQFVTMSGGQDRLMTSGVDLRHAANILRDHVNITDNSPGNDIPGRILRDIIRDIADVSAQRPFFNVQEMISTVCLPDTTFHRTIALISDSIFGYASAVEGGQILVRGGATCGTIADLLVKHHVNLRSYNALIFCVGTNDASNLEFERQIESIELFITLLEPIVNAPSVVIIINTGIGVRGWPNIPNYTQWFLATISGRLTGPSIRNVFICDWSNPGPNNALMDQDRQPDPDLMTSNGLHPTRHGLRHMFKQWTRLYPPIGNVNVAFGDTKYPVGQLGIDFPRQ